MSAQSHANNSSVAIIPSVNHSVNHSEVEDGTFSGCQIYEGFIYVLLAYSIVALILYMVLQKRVKQRSGCCGLPIPINLVYENKDRWVYAAVFGAVSGTFVEVIFSGDLVDPQSLVGSILQGFILFVTMLLFPLWFFALIASVHGRIQVITHVIGFIYVATELTRETLYFKNCLNELDKSNFTSRIDRINIYVLFYGNITPIIFCYTLTALYFLVRGAQAVISILIGKQFVYQHDIRHHLGYVKRLLAKKLTAEPSNSCIDCKALKKLKLVKYLRRFMYKRDPYFKYPVRVFCITGVVVIGLLTLTVDMLYSFVVIVRVVDDLTVDFEIDDIDVVKILLYVAYCCAVVIPIVSYLVTIISFLLSMKAYRDHCKRVWKGDNSFMPKKKEKPPKVLIRSTLFIGWQIAMVIWAWLFYVILLVLVAITTVLLTLGLWYVPVIREWVLRRAILIVSATVTGMIFAFGQSLLFRCLFAKGKTLIVNNSRLFHIYTYFLLFYNALIGIGAAIRRVVTSAVISLFFLTRLDRCLLIRGFEDMDEGYMTYIAAVRIDAAHNNPVMNAFVYFLSQRNINSYRSTSLLDRFVIQKHYQDSRTKSVDHLTSGDYELKYAYSKARKMWQLAYTLIKNPDLVELRRRERKHKKSADKLATSVTSKNSHISDFAFANELAINNEGFEMETIVKEPARKNDGFEVEAIVNKLTVKNDDDIELETTIKEPAVENDDGCKVEAIVKEPSEKNDDSFEVEVIVNESAERNDDGSEVKENP